MHIVAPAQFNMDYKRLYFLFCEDADVYNNMEQIHKLPTDSANPILIHNPDEDTLKMPFSVLCGAHYEVGDKYFTKRAGVNSYQLIVTHSGHGIIEIPDNPEGKTFTRCDCVRGTAVLIDCRRPHLYHVPTGENWNYKHIHFRAVESAEKLCDKSVDFVVFDEGEIEKRIDDLFYEMRHYNINSPFILNNHVTAMLTEMILLKSKASIHQPHLALIEKAAKYMQDNYSSQINISDLAKNEFVSVFYFTRLFKEHFGTSPYNYLVKFRVNKSKKMLIQGFSVKEVAQVCGFNNANNYSRVFKRHNGISPNDYRTNYLKQVQSNTLEN